MIQSIVVNGRERTLGCLPRTAKLGSVFPLLSERIEILPRHRWREVDWSRYVSEVMDQDGVGACNAFAACTALRVCRIMAGLQDVRLSPGHLYGRINGGRDGGSLLGDALKVLADEGVCTTDQVPELEWRKRHWPSGIERIAQKYRLLEAFDAPRFDDVATCVQCGFLADYGILVGRDFDVDSEGWVREGPGLGGHAMCAVGLAKRSRSGRTQWGIVTVNSWGEDWGKGGFGIVPESYFDDPVFTDGWAVRLAVDPSDEKWGPA